jgi:hypothetical protein
MKIEEVAEETIIYWTGGLLAGPCPLVSSDEFEVPVKT